jgi:hypothetical protein
MKVPEAKRRLVVTITRIQDKFIATGARHKLVLSAVTQNPGYNLKPLHPSVSDEQSTKCHNGLEGVRILLARLCRSAGCRGSVPVVRACQMSSSIRICSREHLSDILGKTAVHAHALGITTIDNLVRTFPIYLSGF